MKTRVVSLFKMGKKFEPEVLATITLGTDGIIVCDREDMMQEWVDQGILGRSENGRIYPKDGERFLAELPIAYSSAYLWAEEIE